jgi:hypothetical protein
LPAHQVSREVSFAGRTTQWPVINETVDPSVIRQLNPASCGPTCGAMLLRGKGTVAFQSALALRQGSALTSKAEDLAGAMNRLEGKTAWKGLFVDVLHNPTTTFNTLNAYGSFGTTLHVAGMQVSHMVVVDGLEAGKVIVRDPAEGTRYLMLFSDFLAVWEGQSVWRILP